MSSVSEEPANNWLIAEISITLWFIFKASHTLLAHSNSFTWRWP